MMIFACLALSACGSNGETRLSVAPPPPEMTLAEKSGAGPTQSYTHRMNLALMSEGSLDGKKLNLTSNDGTVEKCKLKDRFDRSSAISFASNDGRKKLALNLKTDVATVERAMLTYTYKFQAGKSKKEHCLYPSRMQGVIGSAFHEMFVREDDSVWDHLRGLKADLSE